MSKPMDPRALRSLAEWFEAVTTLLEPAEATTTLSQALLRAGPVAWPPLARALTAATGRLDAKSAASLLAQAMTTASQHGGESTQGDPRPLPQPGPLRFLAEALATVAARLEPEEAATTLLQAMTTKSVDWPAPARDPFALGTLAQGLSAVAANLEAKDAAIVCGKAASLLSQATAGTTEPGTVQALTLALAQAGADQSITVANNLEPHELASLLIQTLTQTTEPSTLRYLTLELSAVLSRQPVTKLPGSVAGTVALVGTAPTPFAALAGAPGVTAPLLEPPPPPLPPRTLVDLLKHPLCVGTARRLVLDQLTRHYHRPFADQ
jgi:hypothetical protein